MNIDTYVYVKKTAAITIGNEFQVNLIPNNDRPFNSIQVISAVIESDNEYGMIGLRSNLSPLNAYTIDNNASVLSIFDYNTKLIAGHHVYSLSGYEQPIYEVTNNLSNFRIVITNESPEPEPVPPTPQPIPAAEILHFSIIFKLSYYSASQSAVDYRAQVPL